MPHSSAASVASDLVRPVAIASRAAVVVVLLLLAGCGTPTTQPSPPASVPAASEPEPVGGTEAASGTPRPGVVAGPPLPSCVGDREPVALPEGFPEDVPFPPGTVITRARATEAGGAYVEGYAPLTLVEAARFYIAEIPAAGYVHGRGDSEAHEAESPFTGHGIHGRWIVASVDNCPDASALSVITAELP